MPLPTDGGQAPHHPSAAQRKNLEQERPNATGRGVSPIMARAKVLVVNGPNLNLLGEREPGIYGSIGLAEVEERCVALGGELGLEVRCMQSNHEGALIDAVQAARGDHAGLVINAGGLSHGSIALADALRAFPGLIIEVHVSNIYQREAFRHHSHISAVAKGVMCGLGPLGYELALRAIQAEITS